MACAKPSQEKQRSKPLLTGWFRTVYNNPWHTWTDIFNNFQLLKYPFSENLSDIPSSEELEKTLPVTKYSGDELTKAFECSPHDECSSINKIRFMWIGHASCLVQMNGVIVLTDPVFNDYKKRYRPPPCSVENLPNVDVVIISHNHYDHLNKTAVLELHNKFATKLQWYVPLGMRSWFTKLCGNHINCEEFDWWQKRTFQDKLDFVLTPAQHWCGRAPPFDYNKALWGSWCVLSSNIDIPLKFFFGGDTGYCSAFKEIGDEFGPFDLAAIPIGAYHPRESLGPQHVDPKEAFQIHCDIKSKESIGIHWGTFKMGHEPYLSPAKELYEARQLRIESGLPVKDTLFYVVHHGEIISNGREQLINALDTFSFVKSPTASVN